METANATRPKFGEPWRKVAAIDTERGRIWGINAMAEVAGFTGSHDCRLAEAFSYEANAERIVACVNALAGIANPAAIPALIETARGMREQLRTNMASLNHGQRDAWSRLTDAIFALDAEPVA